VEFTDREPDSRKMFSFASGVIHMDQNIMRKTCPGNKDTLAPNMRLIWRNFEINEKMTLRQPMIARISKQG
jgi:hypothetical protein